MSKPPRLTLPAAARAYLLTTERGDFAVHEAGEPVRGTALLVPGFTGSKEDFIGLLEPLAAAGYRVVAVDGRGQHETPGPREEAPYALEELARDVLAQVRALGGDRVHLVGHSLGGLISRAAVLRDPPLRLAHPDEQRAGRDLRGPAGPDEAAGRRAGGDGRRHARNLGGDAGARSAGRGRGLPELASFLRERWLATVPEQLIVTGRTLISEPDRVAELSGVDLPKLVLSGAVDQAWPVPLLDETARRLGARRVVVPGTDHSPNAEDPVTTARELAAFWDSCTGV